MPTGVYVRSKEGRKNMSIARMGKRLSIITKQKLSVINTGKTLSSEHKEKIRKANSGSNNPNYGKRLPVETRKKMSEAHSGVKNHFFGRVHSYETKEKLSLALSGSNSPNYGKPRPAETKRKLSESHTGKIVSKETRCKQRVVKLKRMLKDGTFISIGLNEKPLLDTQEQLDTVTILRQYPIEKLGYIVDGYCPETNTVYEVYEKAHDKTVWEDLQRETEICNLLSCNFHIIWDRTH